MATRRRRTAAVLCLIVLTVLAGCAGGGLGGAGGGDSARSSGDGGSGGAGDGGLAGGDAEDGTGGELPALQQREIIYTGRIVLEVDDFEAARRNVSEAARVRGGFVSESRAQLHRVDEQPYRTGVVVLRVPSENFSVLMEEVEAGGTVVDSETSSEDVTDQLVDVEARLSSLRAERDRLRELFEGANETQDVLAVEERLSEVQTEIERLEARQQSLERQVAYSTITVELREEPPEEDVERWYDVGPIAAFLESIDGVVVTLRALVVGLAYLAPYLVVFGVPIGVAGYAWRRRG